MREPDDEAAPDVALRRVVPRWSATRGRRNLVAIRGRIVRAPRRGHAITLALAGAALFAGTVAVAAVMRLRARAAEVTPGAAPATRVGAKHGGVASLPAEPSAQPSEQSSEIAPSPGAVAAPAPVPVTRVVPTAVAPDIEELMRSADAARRAGRPAQAVPHLRRLLRDHPTDARAPLAAFTLGRILLAELGQPTDAADAFALSRRLAPRGPMASHALAREVEAAARGGDAARARRLAATYMVDYPAGPHLEAVRRHGGIE